LSLVSTSMAARRLRLRSGINPEYRVAMMAALMINVTAQGMISRFLSVTSVQSPPEYTNTFFEGLIVAADGRKHQSRPWVCKCFRYMTLTQTSPRSHLRLKSAVSLSHILGIPVVRQWLCGTFVLSLLCPHKTGLQKTVVAIEQAGNGC